MVILRSVLASARRHLILLLAIPTQVRYLFIGGQLTSVDNRQHQLYEKYRKRP